VLNNQKIKFFGEGNVVKQKRDKENWKKTFEGKTALLKRKTCNILLFISWNEIEGKYEIIINTM
jgi:hypothetical protein